MQAQAATGKISGTATVRDKDGNIKGTFEFSAPVTTPEQEAEAKALVKQHEESRNGNHS